MTLDCLSLSWVDSLKKGENHPTGLQAEGRGVKKEKPSRKIQFQTPLKGEDNCSFQPKLIKKVSLGYFLLGLDIYLWRYVCLVMEVMTA